MSSSRAPFYLHANTQFIYAEGFSWPTTPPTTPATSTSKPSHTRVRSSYYTFITCLEDPDWAQALSFAKMATCQTVIRGYDILEFENVNAEWVSEKLENLLALLRIAFSLCERARTAFVEAHPGLAPTSTWSVVTGTLRSNISIGNGVKQTLKDLDHWIQFVQDRQQELISLCDEGPQTVKRAILGHKAWQDGFCNDDALGALAPSWKSKMERDMHSLRQARGTHLPTFWRLVGAEPPLDVNRPFTIGDWNVAASFPRDHPAFSYYASLRLIR